MKIENRLAIERLLGVIEGIACTADSEMRVTLFDTLEAIEDIILDE